MDNFGGNAAHFLIINCRNQASDLRKIAERVVKIEQLVARAVLIDQLALNIVVVMLNVIDSLADAQAVGIIGIIDRRAALAVALELPAEPRHGRPAVAGQSYTPRPLSPKGEVLCYYVNNQISHIYELSG